MAGGKANLKPKTSAKARGKLGGVASGIAKREKKKLSEFYAEALAREYDIEIEAPVFYKGVQVKSGRKKKLKGQALVDHVFGKMLERCDMVTVKLFENIGDFTEGKKLHIDSHININADDEKVQQILKDYGVSKPNTEN